MISTEIVQTDERLERARSFLEAGPEVMVPFSGELLDLRDLPRVAQTLAEVRDLKTQLDRLRSLLEDILRLESARQGTKTLHLGEFDAEVSGGSKTTFDTERLAVLLTEAGMSEQRLGELIITTVTEKVDMRVAKQVASANPAYAIAIAACREIHPAAWRVDSKRRRTT